MSALLEARPAVKHSHGTSLTFLTPLKDIHLLELCDKYLSLQEAQVLATRSFLLT